MLGTISQQMLDRIALLNSDLYKSAAAVSDAAAITGSDAPPPEGAQPAPEEAPSLADELRARAEGADPAGRQSMLEAAQRLEMVATVNAPPQAPQEQMVEAPQEAMPEAPPEAVEAPGVPPEAPEAKMASHREGRDLTRFAVPLDDKTKQAAILADSDERPPTMDGFRSFLSQFS